MADTAGLYCSNYKNSPLPCRILPVVIASALSLRSPIGTKEEVWKSQTIKSKDCFVILNGAKCKFALWVKNLKMSLALRPSVAGLLFHKENYAVSELKTHI